MDALSKSTSQYCQLTCFVAAFCCRFFSLAVRFDGSHVRNVARLPLRGSFSQCEHLLLDVAASFTH